MAETFDLVGFGPDEARRYALLWAELEQRGTMISSHDLQIAATALVRGWPLLTLDLAGFDRIDDLEVVSPTP